METTTNTEPEKPAPAEAPPRNEAKSAPPAAPRRDFRARARNNPHLRLYLILGSIALIVAGIFLWRYFTSYESTDDAQIDGHVNSISPRIAGNIIRLNVQDNQVVQAGTVIAEIDPADYQIALEKAQADYNEAKATADAATVNVPITSVSTSSQLSSADADVINARATIKWARQQAEAAKASLAEAEANNVKAQNDLARYKMLVQKEEISQQQYDQAVAAANASAAGVDAAKAQAEAGVQQVAQAEAKLSQSEANLRSAGTAPKQLAAIQARADSAVAEAMRKKADLDQARLNLQYTRILSPVNGIVSGRTVEIGHNVQPGQELLKIIPLDDLWVTANFKETQLRNMAPGQKVTIYVDATDKDYKGHVDSISGASGSRFSLLPPENATGNYVKVVQRIPVKIVFEPGETKEHKLRPGMSVEPKVQIR